MPILILHKGALLLPPNDPAPLRRHVLLDITPIYLIALLGLATGFVCRGVLVGVAAALESVFEIARWWAGAEAVWRHFEVVVPLVYLLLESVLHSVGGLFLGFDMCGEGVVTCVPACEWDAELGNCAGLGGFGDLRSGEMARIVVGEE